MLSMFTILIFTNLNIIACKNKQDTISEFYVLGDSLSDTGTETFA
ncbi:hypothetical protein SAP269_00030 [Spiroplasma ixodetis]|uniref:Uncharacterized protein n=1 Tax=Spiroplasma ixodetis TaxID=2141 RepID=A0ABM8JJP0_9MOLU